MKSVGLILISLYDLLPVISMSRRQQYLRMSPVSRSLVDGARRHVSLTELTWSGK